VVAIAAGEYHSLAVDSAGAVWAWGYNGSGRLGDGTTTNRLTPFRLTTLSGVKAVAAGDAHSLALLSDGTVWTWGDNGAGQLGGGTQGGTRPTPGQVVELANVKALAAGEAHALALKQDGTVWSWGSNSHGQLGDGTFTWRSRPTSVALSTDVSRLAAAGKHSLALRGTAGLVSAWGDNFSGQLGNGEAGYYPTPAPVLFP
jgi:alpha-tubulin suppressor-like RCC1 family protein